MHATHFRCQNLCYHRATTTWQDTTKSHVSSSTCPMFWLETFRTHLPDFVLVPFVPLTLVSLTSGVLAALSIPPHVYFLYLCVPWMALPLLPSPCPNFLPIGNAPPALGAVAAPTPYLHLICQSAERTVCSSTEVDMRFCHPLGTALAALPLCCNHVTCM